MTIFDEFTIIEIIESAIIANKVTQATEPEPETEMYLKFKALI